MLIIIELLYEKLTFELILWWTNANNSPALDYQAADARSEETQSLGDNSAMEEW